MVMPDPDAAIRDLDDLVQQQRTELADLRARLDRMQMSPTGRGLMERATLVLCAGSQRTDTEGVADGQLNVYESGGNTILQRFSLAEGAWKEVTLS